LLFENEKSFAYQLKRTDFKKEIISGCGPMIAQLATGDSVTFIDILENESKEIKTGKYLYIPPGATFYFIAGKAKDIILILFEIK
jgi:mannose-6-phosphate isomerase-like protein (cupin superfamily)